MLAKESAGTESGWYVGVEFSGRTRLELERNGDSVRAVAGLNPDPGPFRTRLRAGESFETPVVFLGAASGSADAVGNELRRWVRRALNHARTWEKPNYPLTVNNSWGSGMALDDALARKMIRDSAELGLEMFHIDAGWFRSVGDWHPNPVKFPHGLASIVDEAHRSGLKFGLWVDWTQAGLSNEPGALNVHDPIVRNWLVSDVPATWKTEEFKGQTIDLSVPEARAWAQREVERIVKEYRLDMLEHDGYLVAQGCTRTDHPHAPPDPTRMCIHVSDGAVWVDSENSTDVSYHAVRAYYDVYSKLRELHPDLLLEACNDGGRMVDFGTAAHTDYFSITDTYDPLSNRRAFYDASHVLPAAMLESYVEKWPTPRIENFRYMLRSGMLGWLTIMQDTNAWSAEQHSVAKAEIQLYKTRLRPLIRDADLYHISARPDGVHWDWVEYFDARRGVGVLFAYRGSLANATEHVFALRGLQPDASYRVQLQDHRSRSQTLSGRDLMSSGLRVSLQFPNSSELVFLDKVQ
jgi:alpha-galactosidase